MKKCSKCNEKKDGLHRWCRKCRREDSIKNKKREADRVKDNRKKHPDKWASYDKKTKDKYPEKTKSRNVVSHAVRDGKLIPPDSCESCFKECKPEAHHEDYSKPLDVEWLCKKCHTELHRKVLV